MPTYAERYKFSEVENDGRNAINELLSLCKVDEVSNVNVDNAVKIGNKDIVAKHLVSALQLIERQHMLIVNQRGQIGALLNDLNTTKTDVIRLQGELIKKTYKVDFVDFDDKIVDRLSTAVKDSVENGISKTYSEVAQSTVKNVASAVIPQETLKSVAKQIAVEEEMSRNIMVFGLVEEDNEQLSEKISEVFENLNEKPKLEAIRLGKKRPDTAVRPVKVTLSSSKFVQQILSKSRNLRKSDKFKTVFLSPDRTPEERAQQKELILQLKNKITQEPKKKHFIKGGQICSVDKPVE